MNTQNDLTDQNPKTSNLPAKPGGSADYLPSEMPLAEPALDIPVVSRVVSAVKDTTDSPKTDQSTPPPQNPSVPVQTVSTQKSGSKTTLMLVLLFLTVSIAGFGGSIAYYGIFAHPEKSKMDPGISSPLPPTGIPTPTTLITANPFVTPTISFRNFFTSVAQAYDNPFEETNPFDTLVSEENTNQQPYQNPFENLK